GSLGLRGFVGLVGFGSELARRWDRLTGGNRPAALERSRLGGERIRRRLGFVVLLSSPREHLDAGRDDLGLPVPLPAAVIPGARLGPAPACHLLALGAVLT